MDKKEPIKISLPIFVSIIVILIACVVSIFIFIQNQKLEKEIGNLKEQISQYQTENNKLQEKITTISTIAENKESNTVENDNTEKNTDTKPKAEVFSNEQVKTSLENFLNFRCLIGDGVLKKLNQNGSIDYNSSDTIENNYIATTKVKFSDYKSAMLNYVSEELFNKYFTQDYKANDDGYITYSTEIGGPDMAYSVLNVTKSDDNTYTAKTICDEVVGEPGYKVNENYTFTIKNYNGNCIIDTITKI